MVYQSSRKIISGKHGLFLICNYFATNWHKWKQMKIKYSVGIYLTKSFVKFVFIRG